MAFTQAERRKVLANHQQAEKDAKLRALANELKKPSKFGGPRSIAKSGAKNGAKDATRRPRRPSDEVESDKGSTLDTLAENILFATAKKKRKSRAGKILQGALQGFLLAKASKK